MHISSTEPSSVILIQIWSNFEDMDLSPIFNFAWILRGSVLNKIKINVVNYQSVCKYSWKLHFDTDSLET